MTNEFGATLDRAGYAPSIMQVAQHGRCCCYLCGKPGGYEKMDRHEPWGGANRQKSKELGLWVLLHHIGCHEGPGSVHADGEKARELRKDAQRAAMLRYGWDRAEWIERFGKSELSEEECRRLIVVGRTIREAAEGAPVEVDGVPDPSVASGASSLSQREPGPGAGAKSRVEQILDEYFPDRASRVHRSAFRLIDEPELPF